MFLEDKFVTIKGQFFCSKKLAMWKEEGNESVTNTGRCCDCVTVNTSLFYVTY